MIRNFFICTFLLLANLVWSQSPGYWHLTDADGLPSNTIYHIAEDNNGVIYLGTAAGVCRFNGFDFRLIPNPAAKSSDASDMRKDANGNIWFSNFNHELFWKDSADGIHKVTEIDHSNFNAQGKFVLDFKGNVWFCNASQVYFYNTKQKTIQSWSPTFGSFAFQNFGMEGLLVGMDTLFLLKFDNAYPAFHKEALVRLNTHSKLDKPVLLYQPENRFVISSDFPVISYSSRLKSLNLNLYPQLKSILNYGVLRDGSLWAASTNGVMVFDTLGNPKLNGKLILEGKNTSYLYQDSKGNYWVSTLDEGLFMIGNFEVLTWNFNATNSKQNGVSHIYTDNEKLLIGMQDGAVLQWNGNQWEKLKAQGKRSVYFIGRLGKGDEYVINFNYFKSLNHLGKEITELSAPRGLVLEGDEVLYSNNSGLRRLKKSYLDGAKDYPEPTTLTLETRNEKNQLLHSEKIVVTTQILSGRGGKLYKDQNGRIWINSSSGIYNLNWSQKLLTRIVLSYNPNAMALDFASDETGMVYLAIANEGVLFWTPNGVVKKMGVQDGLLSSTCRRLLWAGRKLWVATNKGLNVYVPETRKIYDFRISDGLVSNDILDIGFYDQKIWIATFKGLNQIPIEFTPTNPFPPELHLTQILVNGKKIPIDVNAKIELNYNENNVEVHFEAINYKSRELLYYKYRLLGQSEQWIRVDGNVHSLSFPALPPGKYVLELLAYNDKNVPSKKVYKLPFTITEPLWKKTWFWLLIAIAAGGVLFWLFRKNLVDQANKEKLENDLISSQLTSLKAQMNPHFMFNALNSIQDFILLNDKKSANMYLGKFSDLMRMVLDMSNKPYISLTNELKAINLYLELEALRFEDSMAYQVHISDELDIYDWQIPSMIIQPFVENAVKHGLLHKRSNRQLNLHFSLSENENTLQVVIEDNGIGRREAERINQNRGNRHESFATGATQQRLSLLNRNSKNNIKIQYIDLKDKNDTDCGTKVIIQIPLLRVTNAISN